MRPNKDWSELYWIGMKLKLSVAMPKLLGGVEKNVRSLRMGGFLSVLQEFWLI